MKITSTILCVHGKISVDLWAMSQGSQTPSLGNMLHPQQTKSDN